MTYLLIINHEYETIEGYVKNKAEFEAWLKKENARRKANGEIPEKESEFELVEIKNLNINIDTE